jgi:hypothetical protein
VEIWFQMLCGVGEDGYSDNVIQQNLKASINGLERIVAASGLSLEPPSARIA